MPHGSCLCGGVTFELDPPLRPALACHCSQCRRTSGHFWAASSVPYSQFHLTRSDSLAWYRSSAKATRGFCSHCGASLFWQPEGQTRIAFAAGALDGPTGLTLADHWHLEDAGDYYIIDRPAPDLGPADRLECGCLCGAVAFSLPGPAGPITACHCSQCRKSSGHFAASFDAEEEALEWQATTGLLTYETLKGGNRGFCKTCGSSLWFRAADGAFSIEAGAVKGATGSALAAHIFTASKGDYYSIDDGLPQSEGTD